MADPQGCARSLGGEGRSFVVATNAADEHHYGTRYVQGSPEDVTSRAERDFLAESTPPSCAPIPS
jgi:hypothetical protein